MIQLFAISIALIIVAVLIAGVATSQDGDK